MDFTFVGYYFLTILRFISASVLLMMINNDRKIYRYRVLFFAWVLWGLSPLISILNINSNIILEYSAGYFAVIGSFYMLVGVSDYFFKVDIAKLTFIGTLFITLEFIVSYFFMYLNFMIIISQLLISLTMFLLGFVFFRKIWEVAGDGFIYYLILSVVGIIQTSAYILINDYSKTLNAQLFNVLILFTLNVFILRVEQNLSIKEINKVKSREMEYLKHLQRSSKLQSLETYSGGIAHNFNNILTIIGGSIELLMLDIDEDHHMHEDLTQINSAVKRGKNIISRLIPTFSKSENEEKIKSNINNLILHSLEMLEKIIKSSIRLETNLTASKQILINPSIVDEIIFNLVSNSRDAILKCGVTENKYIKVNTKDVISNEKEFYGNFLEDQQYIKIEVKDNGIGISKKDQENIFEPFFTTNKSRGHGLGLSTIHRLITNLDGYIFFESSLNVGTTFIIYLPAIEDTNEIERVSKNKDILLNNEGRILLAEDEFLICKQITTYLTKIGYKVDYTVNGKEALEKYKNRKYDLVISDVEMPVMSGSKLYEEIRKMKSDQNFILFSGYFDRSQELLKLMENDSRFRFLFKPFNFTELIIKIQELLE